MASLKKFDFLEKYKINKNICLLNIWIKTSKISQKVENSV